MLWFLSSDFKSFLTNNDTLNVVESSYAIKSIISNIIITQSNVYNQDQFIDGYSSTIMMNSMNITDITFTQSVIKTSLSILNRSDIIVTNVSASSNSTNSVISCSIDSNIYIDDLDYSQSEVSLMLLNNVSGVIKNVHIISITSISSMIQIDNWYWLDMISSSIQNLSNQA